MSGLDVYLDVDGVILPCCLPGAIAFDGWNTHAQTELTMSLTYSPDLIDAINAIAARPGVEMFWLTSWGESAPSRLSEVGVQGTTWPVVGGVEYLRAHGWWKYAAIRTHRRPGRHAIWIDDDIYSEPDAVCWAEMDPEMHTMIPNPESGLTAWQWECVETMADAVLAQNNEEEA